jgi:molybdenum cofactor cytidylyltransferase
MRTAAPRVGAIVLAAGSSTRMGRNKLLLPLGGQPLVRRAAAAAAGAGLDPVIVVVGHDADRVREALAGLPCASVLNRDHAGGIRLSLQAGLRALPAEVSAAVVVLADMPFVTAAMIRSVVEAYLQGTPPLVVSRYGSVIAPPTLYDRSLFPELLGLTGEGAGKPVVLRHQDEARIVSWPEEALADVDVPEDYERLSS